VTRHRGIAARLGGSIGTLIEVGFVPTVREAGAMNVSVLIPWSNRPELEVTLARNAAVFDAIDSEVLVSNCGGNIDRLAGILSDAGSNRLRMIDCGAPAFNKCLAINLAAASATRDVLFILDADVVLDAAFSIPTGVAARECFATLERVREQAATRNHVSSDLTDVLFAITLEFSNAEPVTIETGRRHMADGSRNSPGLIMVAAADFRAVGGMDSHMSHWGWEDIDLMVRLQHVLHRRRLQHGVAYLLTHGDELRNLPPGLTRAESERQNLNYPLGKYHPGTWIVTPAGDAASLRPA
jgi:hypothetical protein